MQLCLNYYKWYPFIINPSEQEYEFILKYYEKSKTQKTCFVDDALMKQPESPIRLGYQLLDLDVEKYGPILNSMMDKEIHNTNVNVLIRVGDQDIDFSSSFKMYIITREYQYLFTLNICLIITFCNFTFTPSWLKINVWTCISKLKDQRPKLRDKIYSNIKVNSK